VLVCTTAGVREGGGRGTWMGSGRFGEGEPDGGDVEGERGRGCGCGGGGGVVGRACGRRG